MKVLTIPQKMSYTGDLYCLESIHIDREIVFEEGEKYAVVLPARYGGCGRYTTHRTEAAAASKARREKEFAPRILGLDGYEHDVIGGGLLAKDKHNYKIEEK